MHHQATGTAGLSLLSLIALSSLLAPAGALATSEPIKPSWQAAERNAFHIFNSVHSAMRQWGSSVHHNGLALIPATVPRGTLLYHGSWRNETPSGPEWLAFEIEHAESFAWPRTKLRPPPPPRRGPGPMMRPDQKPMSRDDDEGSGYLHTYQAARTLHLLYADGMSGAKSGRGTLDTQDLVLLRNATLTPPSPGMPRERVRAQRLCDEVLQPWGYDGLLRMELGFEVILCDFSGGAVSRTSVLRRPRADQPEGDGAVMGRGWTWKWARAAAQRYDGIGARRVALDFSRMVSGFWYDLDVTNPDPAARDQPRLVSATDEQREALRLRAAELAPLADGDGGMSRRGPPGGVDWQGVADMIVSRYAEHLPLLVDPGSGDLARFVGDVMALTSTHFAYPPEARSVVGSPAEFERELDALGRCAAHFLLPVAHLRSAPSFTEEDHMIDRAVGVVSQRICDGLWRARLAVRAYLDEEDGDGDGDGDEDEQRRYRRLQEAVLAGQTALRELMRELDWAEWKRCRGCGVDEVCFVAVWPFGRAVDHYGPSCQNATRLGSGEDGAPEDRYWDSRGL